MGTGCKWRWVGSVGRLVTARVHHGACSELRILSTLRASFSASNLSSHGHDHSASHLSVSTGAAAIPANPRYTAASALPPLLALSETVPVDVAEENSTSVAVGCAGGRARRRFDCDTSRSSPVVRPRTPDVAAAVGVSKLVTYSRHRATNVV